MWPLFGWIPRGIRKVVGHWVLHSEVRLLALGDAPNLRSNPLKRMGQQQLRLRARPDQLVRLGWLGPGWPRVVGKAPQLELEMTALPKQQQPGWLRLQLDVR